jgi:AraC-like DNA-binding protein
MPPRGPQRTAPAAGRYFALSTDVVASGDRREFWRETALNRSDPDFPQDVDPRGFLAQVRGVAGIASELREGRSSALTLRRSAGRCRQDGGGEIFLSGIVASDGLARFRMGETEFGLPAGRLLINDMAVPFTIVMPRYRSVNFRLPRASVASAVNSDPAVLAGRMLPATPLVGLLLSQLTRFADVMGEMDDAARQVALEAVTDFALATLRLETRGGPWEEGAHLTGLRQAARRFVTANLDRQDLSPDTVARALRCSRTHLYRLFAGDGQTVMGYVRDVRLGRSRDMLADAECRLTIGEIAQLCGFDDPSTFSRSFRQRYGCQPGDVRRESRSAAQ